MPDTKDVAAKLRAPFPAEQIGKLPRVTCGDCSDRNKRCDQHRKTKCNVCQAYVSEKHIHIDYVGHADVTSRLLEADPAWNWEPAAADEHGLPVFDTDRNGSPVGLWIKLTVGGVTRLGYGSVPSGQSDAVKVLIGDALRNAAMRFGVALDLWAKGDRADPTAENATASAGQAARRGRESFEDAAPAPRRGQAIRPTESQRPEVSATDVDADAQAYADEASQATTLDGLKAIHTRAREARKLAALVWEPGGSRIGGLGQYFTFRKGVLEAAEKALAGLRAAGTPVGLDDAALDKMLTAETGHGLEDATPEEMDKVAEMIRVDSGAAA